MPDPHRPRHEVLTDLVLNIFRTNGLLISEGDALVAPLGITSARWQVLGAIAAVPSSQPVSWLARDMGASRQNVQRIVNDLARDGLIEFKPNPHHRRAQLVAMTDKGKSQYAAAMQLQRPWVEELGEGIPIADLEAAIWVLVKLNDRMGRNRER